ncbi:unnamed protein product [Durusdinium trenchii]|uniref:Uncharacterized protein n=1 Tax=Durusdinium trenchii TaxID=1381693 RepID=A0ABP0HXN9_9DINO
MHCSKACFVISLVQWGHSSGWLADDEGTIVLVVGTCLIFPIGIVAFLHLLAVFLAHLCYICCRTQDTSATNVELSLLGPSQWNLLLPAHCQVPVREVVLTMPAGGEASDPLVSERTESRSHLEFQILDYVAKVGPLEAPVAVLLGGNEHHSEIVYADEDMARICQRFTARFAPQIADALSRSVISILHQRTKPREILVVNISFADGDSDQSESDPGEALLGESTRS